MLYNVTSMITEGKNVKKSWAFIKHFWKVLIYSKLRALLIPNHTGSLWLDLFQNSRNIAFTKIWHFLALEALKDTKEPMKYWKRPTKAAKVILKARESKSGKILVLLYFCNHLVSKMKRIQYFDVSWSKRPKRPH